MTKGVIGIAGATVLGVILIIGSLYMSKDTEAISTDTLPAGAITIRDENNNGIPDWEESVRDRIFESIPTPTSTPLTTSDVDYVPPTTLTGRFSEAFLQDYLEGKMSGEDFSNPEVFVAGAVSAIEEAVQSKKHTRAELRIVATSPESVRAYGNELVDIMNRHSVPSDPELVILQAAIDANDAKPLAKLEPIQDGYANIIADSLRMDVPDVFALAHISLVNAYEAVYTDITSMEQVFDDPLLALARTRTYPEDVDALAEALRQISVILDANGVVYANTEPGSFFYIFDAV